MSSKVVSPSDSTAIPFAGRRPALPLRTLRRYPILPYTLALLMAAPAAALELGEASIKSGLGESLLVEIPYRLAGNERLTPSCVSLVPSARVGDALPTYVAVTRISVGATSIEIFDDHGVREPLIGLNVAVQCNTAPHFVRSYQLFVDPPARAAAFVADHAAAAAAAERSVSDAAAAAAATARTAPALQSRVTPPEATARATASAASATAGRSDASPRARGHAGGTVTPGQTYRVVRGDTLSGIASRVAGRSGTIRETSDAIFAANGQAFAHGNRDLIEEGALIEIPGLAPAATAAVREAPAAAPGVDAAPVSISTVAPPESPPAALAPIAKPIETPIAVQPPPAELSSAAVEPVAPQPPRAAVPAAPEPAAAAPAAAVPAAAIPAAPEPVAAPARAEPARGAAPVATTWRLLLWGAGLLALGVAIGLGSSLAFIRRRRKLAAEPDAREEPRPARARRPAMPAPSVDVVEHRAPGADLEEESAVSHGANDALAIDASSTVTLAQFNDLALPIGATDSVDLDVGTPLTSDERVDWFEHRVALDATDAGDETVEENAATIRMADVGSAVAARRPPAPPEAHSSKRIDDEQMTMTIVELEMLRQDYEAEHTLTQQLSQELRHAVADLEATKAARAAARATSRYEPPQSSRDESRNDSTTTRTRVK
jgi:hypothetical protein